MKSNGIYLTMTHDIEKIIEKTCKGRIRLEKKQDDLYQILMPVYYEDGDMVDVYMEPIPGDDFKVRLVDYGTTLMKLSYSYELNSPSKENIFQKILLQSGIKEVEGGLILESHIDMLFPSLMQFTGCQQKILNMKMWRREIVRTMFMEDLESFIQESMSQFNPEKDVSPLDDYLAVGADYRLTCAGKTFYVFAINNKDKAKNSAISMLEFQKAGLKYIGVVVHEDISSLPNKEQTYLLQNADKQFLNLDDFRKGGASFMNRIAA